MKNSLCVLLALSLCSIVAQDARLEFGEITLRDTPYSVIGGVPNPIQAQGEPQMGKFPKLGLLTAEIPFPAEHRPADRPAKPEGDVRAALRSAFHFDPGVRSADGHDMPPGGEPILRLQPFHVFGDRDRETAEAIDEQRAAREAEEFNFASGGRIGSVSFGPFEADFGIWKPKSVVPFAKNLTPPEIELLRIKW
jgi:hypothetical protein